MQTILKTDHLYKSYRKRAALDGLDITINKGDIYGLVGNNGAGKTTFMKIIMGLSKKTKGSFEIFGIPDNEAGPQERKRISAIIEAPAFYPYLNGLQNLLLHQMAAGIPVSREAARSSLETVGLKGEERKKVRNYSLGMKQRLGLARALLSEAEFIILDEPTNGLDPSGILQLRDLIMDLKEQKGTTFLISSHHVMELSHMITKLGIIKSGRMVKEIDLSVLNKELEDAGETLENYIMRLAN